MNYISLGYFCSIASELEKFGLRTESSPFDWVISDFEGVIMAIQEHFAYFVNYEYLSQNMQNRAVYMNTRYKVEFFHDFAEYTSLKKQLQKVQVKYGRRIDRFYKSITQPTLFIRYISDEETVNGVSKELLYIEKNYEQILALLRSFNTFNDILFIANEGVCSSTFAIYHVSKDNNDVVSRTPFCANPTLYRKFSDAEIENKQKNIARYLKKEKYKRSIFYRAKEKVIFNLKRMCLKEYFHEKQYSY